VRARPGPLGVRAAPQCEWGPHGAKSTSATPFHVHLTVRTVAGHERELCDEMLSSAIGSIRADGDGTSARACGGRIKGGSRSRKCLLLSLGAYAMTVGASCMDSNG
jgi:hypothetical protein